MTTLAEVNRISSRGLTAVLNGEKLYSDWTREAMIEEVLHIKARNQPCPNINYDRLEEIPEEILRSVLLKKSSWHHVNCRPEWFYTVDEQWVRTMRNIDIRYMENDAAWFEDIENKPRLAEFRLYTWKVSLSGHQYCKRLIRTGICYNGIAYFESGYRQAILKDRCEIVTVHTKTPKHLKPMYDSIRKKMRSFQVYC